jgi:hypothetical protein
MQCNIFANIFVIFIYERSRACSMSGGEEKCISNFGKKPEGRKI